MPATMVSYRNVNTAFLGLVNAFQLPNWSVEDLSRNGPVRKAPGPMIVEFTHPLERVLFNPIRDANPFFHVYEALWMLAGKNDVESLKYYASRMGEYSDDGVTLNGAYGYRWRQTKVPSMNSYGDACYRRKDQLTLLIDHLKENPNSRRAVLQMWNIEDDLLKIDTSKDVCCNLSVLFSLRSKVYEEDTGGFREDGSPISTGVSQRFLDMTVTNRSNDLVWGMLGTNAVHFSFLQEYMALCLGVEVGTYYQITNNLHVYPLTESGWRPEEWNKGHQFVSDYNSGKISTCQHPLFLNKRIFDKEVKRFVEDHRNGTMAVGEEVLSENMKLWDSPFLEHVASPMCLAFHAYKRKDWTAAFKFLKRIDSEDWNKACTEWIQRRKDKHVSQ